MQAWTPTQAVPNPAGRCQTEAERDLRYGGAVDLHLFDLDGTLSDSGEAIFLALNEGLITTGFDPIDRADLAQFVGPPLAQSVAELLTSRSEDPSRAPEVVTTYRRAYRHLSISHAALYPGVQEMLDRIRGPMGVVTSKPIEFSRPLIAELGLLDLLAVVGAPDGTENERKHVTLSRALTEIGSAPRWAVMIGDRHHDIEAGLSVGTFTIGVTWGFGDRVELERAGAHLVVDHPEGIA